MSKSNSRLIFDLKEPNMRKSEFFEFDWSDFYAGAQEVIPPNALKAHREGCDSANVCRQDHAGNNVS
jgi:hypothetical protein